MTAITLPDAPEGSLYYQKPLGGLELLTRRSTINLTATSSSEFKRHYIKFLVEGLHLTLDQQFDQDEDFNFISTSSQGRTSYRVSVWRQFDMCSGDLAPCRKHGEIYGACSCQANTEQRLLCKHLVAAYLEARRILAEQGYPVRTSIDWVEEATEEAQYILIHKGQRPPAKPKKDKAKGGKAAADFVQASWFFPDDQFSNPLEQIVRIEQKLFGALSN